MIAGEHHRAPRRSPRFPRMSLGGAQVNPKKAKGSKWEHGERADSTNPNALSGEAMGTCSTPPSRHSATSSIIREAGGSGESSHYQAALSFLSHPILPTILLVDLQYCKVPASSLISIDIRPVGAAKARTDLPPLPASSSHLPLDHHTVKTSPPGSANSSPQLAKFFLGRGSSP